MDFRKLQIPPITRKITFPKVHVTNNYKQNPPKKKGHIFLNFRASTFPTGIYYWKTLGGLAGSSFSPRGRLQAWYH
jgi:hypothetical protein